MMPPGVAPKPQYVPLPEALVRTIRNRATGLGLTVLLLSLVIGPILVLWPSSLVAYPDPMRIGVPIFAGMTAFCLFSAGAMTLGTRASVSTGWLKLNDMRITRVVLLFSFTLSTMGALLAFGILALVKSTPPDRYRQDVPFGTAEWLYVLLLAGAVVLVAACFLALRPVLWRSPHVAKEWLSWG